MVSKQRAAVQCKSIYTHSCLNVVHTVVETVVYLYVRQSLLRQLYINKYRVSVLHTLANGELTNFTAAKPS
jgi:hypothetical protein